MLNFKNKKKIYIIFSITCIILITFSKIFITNNVFLLKQNLYSNRLFVNKNEAYNTIINSDYFKNLNLINMKIRGCNNLDKCKELYKNNIINFTENEKNILINLIKLSEKYLKNKNYKLKSFNQTPWRFSKITTDIEQGFPHTHSNIIYLSNSFFNNDDDISKLETLIHEKLHVYQRTYPKKTQDLYKKYKFYKTTKRNFPMRRANPDLDNYDYNYKGIIFYKKLKNNPTNLMDSYNEFISIDNNSRIEVIKELKDMKYINEHPNEIFANLISNKIINNNLNNILINYLN